MEKKRKMYKQKLVIYAVMLFTFRFVSGQTAANYTLDSLQSMARNRYPQTKQLLMANLKGTEAIKNINNNWLPKSSVVGAATYQSEVSKISLPANLPISVESPAKDQYKAGIELSQLIFDGGVNATQKSIEELNLKSETNRIEGELLKIKSNVNGLFLALLINKESGSALDYIKKDLTERHSNIQSSVQSGTMLITSMKELEAEMIGVDQKIIENKSQRLSLLANLSMLVQEKLDTSTVFVLPIAETVFTDDVTNRPEYKQLTTQIELVDYRTKLINRSNLPRVALFGNGYYGRPGFNFFNNDFRYYGITGINFSWNIGGNYISIHQKRQLQIDKDLIENQRSLFEMGLHTQLVQQKLEIEKLKELIVQDDTLTAKRTEVKQIAAIQYENGSITTTDYILKLNAETQAMITGNMHKIQLCMATINYKTLINK